MEETQTDDRVFVLEEILYYEFCADPSAKKAEGVDVVRYEGDDFSFQYSGYELAVYADKDHFEERVEEHVLTCDSLDEVAEELRGYDIQDPESIVRSEDKWHDTYGDSAPNIHLEYHDKVSEEELSALKQMLKYGDEDDEKQLALGFMK